MQTPTLEPTFSDMQVAGICKMCALESGAAQAIAAYRERLVAARDAECQARVDTLLEDNARSEEQVKKQFATAVSFKARAEKAESRVDKLEAALRYLYESGPTPEGFCNLEKDCYEYAIDMLNPGEDGLPDKDPRWFDGWLRMIEESAKRAALGR